MFDIIIKALVNFFTVDVISAYAIVMASGFIICIFTWIHDLISVGKLIRNKIKGWPVEYSTFDWVMLPIKVCVLIILPQAIYQFVLSFI